MKRRVLLLVVAGVLLFVPPPPPGGGKAVPVKVEEWVQREWLTPGVSSYRDKGDYWCTRAMYPGPDGRALDRAPAWLTVSFPDNFVAGRAVVYDAANDRVLFIGTIGSDHLGAAYTEPNHATPWTWTGPNELSSATANVGGLDGRNVAWWGGDLYVIGADKKVYRGSDYTAALAEFYGSTDAYMLAPYGDRMYLVSEGGDILRLNDADNAFEAHYTVVGDLDVIYLSGYRNYLYAVAQAGDGTLYILQIDDASATTVGMHVVAHVPVASNQPDRGCLYTQYGDRLYLSPGPQTTATGGSELPIYSYRYSTVGRVDLEARFSVVSTDYPTLLPWDDALWLARISTISSQECKLHLIPDSPRRIKREAAAAIVTAGTTFKYPVVVNAGGHLIVIHRADGFKHAGPNTGYETAGYVHTAYLDFGHPGRQKRLESITVLFDGKLASDNTVTIKYRTDNTTDWATAGSGQASTRRVSATGLGVSFYQLQVRVEFSDVTGDDERALEAIGVVYTRPE